MTKEFSSTTAEACDLTSFFLFQNVQAGKGAPPLPPSLKLNRCRGSVPWVKREGRNGDHSPASSVEVKIEWSQNSIPHLPIYFHSAHTDNFTCFYLIFRTGLRIHVTILIISDKKRLPYKKTRHNLPCIKIQKCSITPTTSGLNLPDQFR
jgi:hypothetical protein